MGKVVNIYHLLDGPHRAAVAATTAARLARNKCNGSNNPVQLPCLAVGKRTIQVTDLEDEISNREHRLQPPHTRVVNNTFMMIMLEQVELVEAVEVAIMVLLTPARTVRVNRVDPEVAAAA